MKNASKFLFVLALFLLGLNTVKAQQSSKDDKQMKATEVKNLVNSKDFVFEATNKGKMPLNYHKYDVAIAKDTLVANLPGHTGPVKFDCTKFDFDVVKGKNGVMDVIIKPNTNMADVKRIKMEITPQGHASVFVSRRNGGPLSLAGYIKQEDY